MRDPLHWLDAELASLADRGLLRRLRTYEGRQAAVLRLEGREVLNFGSNDYLSLASDDHLIDAARQALDEEGCGSSASPLVVGHSSAVARLEERIAAFESTEAALVFPSGFAANMGTIAAIVGPGDAVFSDELNHASIIDGCRLSRAAVLIYRHCDCGHLEEQLREARSFRRRLIVTDTLFSMDGDWAPLVELAELAGRYDAVLMVDEAHATGVFGPRGRGLAEELGVEREVAIRVGTLSKAVGAAGGFVCGRRSLVEWLLNRARSYVFSTALPPAIAAAAMAALDVIEAEPERRRHLLARAGELRERLAAQGWSIGRSQSQILPLLVGSAARAVELSERLADRGIWAPAIRPPSVPENASRLRVSLCYGHDDAMIERLEVALAEVKSLVQ